MAFNPNAYNTRAYEIPAIASGMTSLAPGTAVKLIKLPTGLSAPDFYCQVDAAGIADTVFGVVSSQGVAISSTAPGRIVLMNTGMVPVLMNATASKGDLVSVNTTDGKWEKSMTGSLMLFEAGAAATLSWATPV